MSQQMPNQLKEAKAILQDLIEKRESGRINLNFACASEVAKWLSGFNAKYTKYQPNWEPSAMMEGFRKEVNGMRVDVESGNFLGAFTHIFVSKV